MRSDIKGYAKYSSYKRLCKDMLGGVATNSCIQKADAHIAICYKYALSMGFDDWELEQYYEDYHDDTFEVNRFANFREHTRTITDYLDEVLEWNMKLETITPELVSMLFLRLSLLVDSFELSRVRS